MMMDPDCYGPGTHRHNAKHRGRKGNKNVGCVVLNVKV